MSFRDLRYLAVYIITGKTANGHFCEITSAKEVSSKKNAEAEMEQERNELLAIHESYLVDAQVKSTLTRIYEESGGVTHSKASINTKSNKDESLQKVIDPNLFPQISDAIM